MPATKVRAVRLLGVVAKVVGGEIAVEQGLCKPHVGC